MSPLFVSLNPVHRLGIIGLPVVPVPWLGIIGPRSFGPLGIIVLVVELLGLTCVLCVAGCWDAGVRSIKSTTPTRRITIKIIAAGITHFTVNTIPYKA
ncbi:MAG TPA: hypothetical protein VGK02_06175 [Candidatus Aquicultor sp.]